MSNPDEHSDASKPIVKDKNPHNYRKVGYSMIVISVSLVLIGLLVWAIGDNYHFSSDIMANQEIDAMTPKHGFNLVFYDTQQPVGAKLKLLDSASTINDAQQKQIQYTQQNPSPLGKVLIFNETLPANKQLVHDTVAAITQYQADLAKAQAAAQAASVTTSQTTTATANQTISTASSKQNTTSSNATKPVISIPPSTSIQMNATVATPVSNGTMSGKPTGYNTENLAIGANVTITHSSKIVTSNATTTINSNATTSNTAKSKSISESVGVNSG
jgi:hypothetical protein